MTADFSSESMEAKRQWYNIFKVLKEKTCQFRILYLVKISIRKGGEIKVFSAGGKLMGFTLLPGVWSEVIPCVRKSFSQKRNDTRRRLGG